jgi:hypothetical protein
MANRRPAPHVGRASYLFHSDVTAVPDRAGQGGGTIMGHDGEVVPRSVGFAVGSSRSA